MADEIVRVLQPAERMAGEILLAKLIEVQQAWQGWSAAQAGPGRTLRPGTWDVVRPAPAAQTEG